MSQFRSLDLHTDHVTKDDLIKLLQHEDGAMNEDETFEFVTSAWDSGIEAAFYASDPKILRKKLEGWGLSKFFCDIAFQAWLDGNNAIRFGEGFDIEPRFALPSAPDVPVESPSSYLAQIVLDPTSESANRIGSTVSLLRTDSDMAGIEVSTAHGPVLLGLTVGDDGLRITIFGPKSTNDVNDKYDAKLTVGIQGTAVSDVDGNVVMLTTEDEELDRGPGIRHMH